MVVFKLYHYGVTTRKEDECVIELYRKIYTNETTNFEVM